MMTVEPWLEAGPTISSAKPCREDELLEKMRALLNIAYDYEEMSGTKANLLPDWRL